MIRPFGIGDVLLVSSLQRSDTPLAIEHILTHPRPPLWLAMTAPWPWAGTGVATYVLRLRGPDQQTQTGFVQLLKRSARPEADLLHLAPALPLNGDCDCDLDPQPIWRHLLTHCAHEAAQYGIERLYVSIPDGGPEQSCLAESNFRLYARETIYRLAAAPEVGSTPAGFRRQRAQDSWALQRLYLRGTPILVQQAEGALSGRAGSPSLSWWEPDRWRGVVWTPAGEVRGVVQVHFGRAGHWLRILGANALTAREVRALIEQGLRLIGPVRRNWRGEFLPVYVTVRDYDLGLSGALTGFGFAPLTDRARFVRHTTATAARRAHALVPVRDSIKEVAVR
jgi:hypothetical protein